MSVSSEWYESSKADVLKALNDEKLRTALNRATTVFSANKKDALMKLQHMPHLRKRAKEIKLWSINHLPELISMVRENIEALGGVFCLAKDAEQLNNYVSKVCLDHGAKLIVKGKSMVTEEIFLNDALTVEGFEVIETDLGERIIQLRGEKPSHFIVPAIHIPREEVSDLFSKVANKKLPPDIPALTKVAREMLREKFTTAEIGITGANVISADTSTIFVIENEGNARFTSNAPPTHICITGIEKIVPTLEDAMVITQLLPPYATGQLMACYVSLITGPSRTADIELTTSIGMHGPKELYLVLLDNGRLNMIEDSEFKEAAHCIRCGSCLNDCPVYREIGGQTMGHRYVGGIGIILTSFFHGLEKAAPFAFACTGCGNCKNSCPLEIDIPSMVEKIRRRLDEAGYMTPPHAQIRHNLERYNNPFGEPVEKRITWLKK